VTVYFNALAARLYKKHLRILDGKGMLFAIADDVKIATVKSDPLQGHWRHCRIRH
jgi:hypothetical protein